MCVRSSTLTFLTTAVLAAVPSLFHSPSPGPKYFTVSLTIPGPFLFLHRVKMPLKAVRPVAVPLSGGRDLTRVVPSGVPSVFQRPFQTPLGGVKYSAPPSAAKLKDQTLPM